MLANELYFVREHPGAKHSDLSVMLLRDGAYDNQCSMATLSFAGPKVL
jgi:hypothetical protein